MNEVVYFSTKETIDKKILEEFLSDKFLITNFIWVEDFYVFATANEIDFPKLTSHLIFLTMVLSITSPFSVVKNIQLH